MHPAPLSSRPRVALIGVSGYAVFYVRLLREALARGECELVAAVVINPEQERDVVAEFRAAAATIYADAETFFEKEAGRVDLCLIPVGIPWHTRLTVSALRAGMNVLVEKPLAGSAADAAAIRRAEADTGRWVAVGFQDLYAPEVHALRLRLLAGEIGRLREIRMIGQWPRPRHYYARNPWAGRLAADGAGVLDSPLNNAFAHFVNLALYLAGPAEVDSMRVAVESVELYRAHRIESFDTAVVRAESAGGVRFWFGVTHAAPERRPELRFTGTEGSVDWEHEVRYTVTARGAATEFALGDSERARRLMFSAALARVNSPEVFICDTGIAERHTAFIESVHGAALTRDFAAGLVEWPETADPGQSIPFVSGLADAMDSAFRQGAPLHFERLEARAAITTQ